MPKFQEMTRLVRAVADFPSVSYLLAYDRARVSEALGAGNEDRGSAYLEKIVQIEISVPLCSEPQLRMLFFKSLDSLELDAAHVSAWKEESRFDGLLDILFPSIVKTPRDVKRLIEIFGSRETLVGDESDWTDLLAFSALEAKAPQVVSRLRLNFRRYLLNTSDNQILRSKAGDEARAANIALNELHGEQPGEDSIAPDDAVTNLIKYVFPATNETGEQPEHPNALAYERPLATLLHLNLPEGEVSTAEIRKLFGLAGKELDETLRDYLGEDVAHGFLARFEELYPYEEIGNERELWPAFAAICQHPTDGPQVYSIHNRGLPRRMRSIFLRLAEKSEHLLARATSIVDDIERRDLFAFSVQILSYHIAFHGLHGYAARSFGPSLFDKEDTEFRVHRQADRLREKHVRGELLDTLVDPYPLVLLHMTDYWDDTCQDLLLEFLKIPENLDRFVFWFFGGNYAVSKEFLDQLVGDARVSTWIRSRSLHLNTKNTAPVPKFAYDRLFDELDLDRSPAGPA